MSVDAEFILSGDTELRVITSQKFNLSTGWKTETSSKPSLLL
ncbi:hypothetical protein [Scytonema sp. UIC 10036]|nr:hypothetical protein [Scytonema sp. UIC 10036]